MMPDRYARVKSLFLRACDLDEDSRRALLDRECLDDSELREQVESLLKHHGEETIIRSSPTVVTPLPESHRSSSGVKTALHAFGLAVEQLSSVLFGNQERRAMTVILTLLFLWGMGAWMHSGIQQSLQTILAGKLQTILNADVAALELWLKEKQGDAEMWARQPVVREAVGQLLPVGRSASSPADELRAHPALKLLREALAGNIIQKGVDRFAIVDRSGLVLAAEEDAFIGGRLNAAGIAANDHVCQGRTVITKPRPDGLYARNRPIRWHVPMIWVSTPIRLSSSEIVGSLSFGMRADEQFTQILSVARMGRTGETYAFDSDGLLLSESRFDDQLKAAGMIPRGANSRSIFNVQIRDPGGDVTTGYRPSDPISARPLTKMAAAAVVGQEGVDLDGYRDYRGVRVIGAWRWLSDYDIGVATEVDYDEAYATLRYPVTTYWIWFSILCCALCALLVSGCRIARLRAQVGISSRLGEYTLTEKIGEGGMGVVYSARHSMLRRPTAVKLLKPDRISNQAISRFEREVQLTSRLSHPNTIEIYDYGRTSEGIFYYAMEFLPGISLAQLMAETAGPLPPARVIHILRQVCGSLQEAHDLGQIHRDIKPANIMLCQQGGLFDFVKVLDFGLVKRTDKPKAPEVTDPEMLAGTPLYIAPERLKDPSITTPESDLYSFGAVAFNLITGRLLFDTRSEVDLLYHAIHVAPPRPSEFSDVKIPEELDQLIVNCLAKEPSQRPRSVADVAAELSRLGKRHPWSQEQARQCWQSRPSVTQSESKTGVSQSTLTAGALDTDEALGGETDASTCLPD